MVLEGARPWVGGGSGDCEDCLAFFLLLFSLLSGRVLSLFFQGLWGVYPARQAKGEKQG